MSDIDIRSSRWCRRASSNLWRRLEQRRLVQWALGYAACALIALQVLGLMAESFEWSRGVMRLGFGVAVLGFLLTLVLAWFHGAIGTQRVTRAEAVLLALCIVLGGALIWHFERPASVPPDKTAQGTGTDRAP